MVPNVTGAKRATAGAGAYSDKSAALIPAQATPSAVHIKSAQVMQVGMAAVGANIDVPWAPWNSRPHFRKSYAHTANDNIVTPIAASDELIEFIKNYEDYHDMPYRGLDSQNRTIGYGHVIDEKKEGIKYNGGISEEEATDLLKGDLDRVVYQYLNPFLKENAITLNQQQYDALVDFTFNTGPSWITTYDDLKNILLSNNITYEAMHTEFMDWTKVNGEPALGLYRRRMDELEIFFSGDYNRDYPNWP